MVNTCQGDYIPYRYVKVPGREEVRIFTRGVDRDDRKTFVHSTSKWIIIDPHRYIDETDDDILKMLATQFQTSSVIYDENSDRFIVKDSTIPIGSDSFAIEEQSYRSVVVLPDSYTTHIIMNSKRFYNSLEANGSTDGTWLNSRQSKNHQGHHYFLTSKEFCKATDPTHTQGPKSLRKLLPDVDVIFSNLDQETAETIYGGFPTEIDFVRVSHISDDSPKALTELGVWYAENISQLYKLSFISARNLSDVWPQNKDISRKIAEDILLGFNLSLYSGNGVMIAGRIPESFGTRGKYSNVYVYQVSNVLRGLLEKSEDPLTRDVGALLDGIENFSDIINTIFLSPKLAPEDYVIPNDNVFYFDQHILCSTERLYASEYNATIEKVDYIIVLGAQSMIKCIKGSNSDHRLNDESRMYLPVSDQEDHIIFTGIHHICRPLFPAVLKAVRGYAIAMMYNPHNEWEILTRLVDLTASNFEITIIVTDSNVDQYKYLLDDEEIEIMEKRNVELKISAWLTGMGTMELSRNFDQTKTVAPSLGYIKRILRVLDLIPSSK